MLSNYNFVESIYTYNEPQKLFLTFGVYFNLIQSHFKVTNQVKSL